MSDPLRVFISYRRSDCLAQANALYDGLQHRLRHVKLFMDLDSIPPGVDFERHIRREIEQTDVVLVMIGDNWLDAGQNPKVRRIDEDNDFVRLEVESALAIDSTRLIPVLVEGASMPVRSELPRSIQRLARFHAFEMSDHRWGQDIQRMAETIEQIRQEKLGTTPTVALPPPPPPPPSSPLPAPTTQSRPPAPRYAAPTPPVRTTTTSGSGFLGLSNQQWLMASPFALTCCSCGLLAPAATGWLAMRQKQAPQARRRLLQWTAVLTAAVVASLVLLGVAPVDEEGTPTGVAGNTGGTLMLVVMVLTLVLLAVYRHKAESLAGTSTELERRERRSEYRALVSSDPMMARSIHVGRPDLARDYDDGGLVDLNSIPIAWLRHHSPLTSAEVESISAAREQLGSFSSPDELLAFGSTTSNALTQWVREHAVTL